MELGTEKGGREGARCTEAAMVGAREARKQVARKGGNKGAMQQGSEGSGRQASEWKSKVGVSEEIDS